MGLKLLKELFFMAPILNIGLIYIGFYLFLWYYEFKVVKSYINIDPNVLVQTYCFVKKQRRRDNE